MRVVSERFFDCVMSFSRRDYCRILKMLWVFPRGLIDCASAMFPGRAVNLARPQRDYIKIQRTMILKVFRWMFRDDLFYDGFF